MLVQSLQRLGYQRNDQFQLFKMSSHRIAEYEAEHVKRWRMILRPFEGRQRDDWSDRANVPYLHHQNA
jgi:hypothetical protein